MTAKSYSPMKPALVFAALALLGLGTPTMSDAAGVQKKVALQSTARTLGGPGVARPTSGDSVDVLSFSVEGEESRLLCATAHNFGPGNASLRIGNTSGGGSSANKPINPKQTQSLCAQGTVVSLACEEGRCEVIWRVDNGD
jgi:hypothetical protein